MKKTFYLACLVMTAVSMPAFADKSTKIIRGGLGFLYPDNNSFSNPGQFPLSYGMAVEAGYTRSNGASANQTLTPSFVYGNGKIGVGAYYSRSGTDLVGSGTTNGLGVGLGASFLKDKLTLGVGYSNSFQTPKANDGNVLVTANLNGPQRHGPSVGVGLTSSLNQTSGNRQGGNVNVGYSFQSNDNIEAGITFADFRDMNDFSPFFAGTFGTQYVYAGGSYTYGKAAGTHTVAARLGFILGRYMDLSAYVSSVLQTGGAMTYGTSLRASF